MENSKDNNIRPAAAIVLLRGEKFWLGHRGITRFLSGFWVFPGGACEKGESFLEAARRELAEETGLTLESEIVVHPFARAITPAYSQYRYDVRVYRCDLSEEREPKPDGLELVDGTWLTATEALAMRAAGELQLAPPTYRQILQLQRCLEKVEEWPDETSAFAQPPPLNEQLLPLCPGLTLVPLRTSALPPAAWTNTALIGETRFFILDPGGVDLDVLRSEVQARLARGQELAGVLLSHHHRDHIEGYPGLNLSHIPLYCHLETARLLPQGFPEPELLLDQDELLVEAGLSIVAHHSPGHAPGHLAFELKERRALLAGDMVSSLSSIVIPPESGDLTDYLASLEKLRALNCPLVVPAHGPPYGKGSDPFGDAIRHRKIREEQVIALLHKGSRTVEDLTGLIYSGLDPELVPAAHANVTHYLKKLSAEGVARQEQGCWSLTGGKSVQKSDF